MSTQECVVRQAPGKLFVAGEYAVVEPGTPAILAAVDREVTVTVSGHSCTGIVISSDLTPRAVHWQWADGRLAPSTGHDEQRVRSTLAHVVSAIETIGQLYTERGLLLPSLNVTVSSRLHQDGVKFGLGSSGAVTVATIDAVTSFCGLQLTAEDRFRLALIASAALDAKGSGGDLAASAWGGWITYQAPDRDFVLDLASRRGVEEALRAPWPHFEVRRLPPPAGLSLQVGWTGNPASSASLVAGLHRQAWRGSAAYQAFVETSTAFVRDAGRALEDGDGPGLLRQIVRARRELAKVDDTAGLGIFTTELTVLCDAAEAAGGAAKPSGAGGGDCGIALFDAQARNDIAEVRQRWATAGVLPLPVRPALEGIEE